MLRDPSSDAAAERTAKKILQRLGLGNFLHAAGHLDLTLQRDPGEQQRRLRILRNLSGLAATIVREKNESPAVDALQQNRAARNAARAIRRAQRHGIRLKNPRAPRLLKPHTELHQRIVVE